MSKKTIVVLILAFMVLLGVGYLVTSNFLFRNSLSITFQNVSEIYLAEKENYDPDNESTRERLNVSSGEQVSLKNKEYLIFYYGNDGYESGQVGVDLREANQNIVINPSFSEEKLTNLLNSELTKIQTEMGESLPKLGLYIPQTGKLYKYGEWYATTLVYNGEEPYNFDTLRLVMKKEDERWKLLTYPPEIILTTSKYPDIPLEVLNDVNNNQKPKLQTKYTGE